ncbi:uncharacterized protein [Pleurodeles waltl]|uniref:uncharacterized protein isoform X2 n=1 Tax=Pleurodeles waltl TaxID=8319 RepID=UPI0037099679
MELSVSDHLEGILSDFEALKRSFDMEDIDDLPAFSPSSPLSSPFSPSSPGMVFRSNVDSRISPEPHLPLYQSHIRIGSNPSHSPGQKSCIGSSLSFNRGTIQMAKSNGNAHASLTRVSSFQTRLQSNGFSLSGPGSDSESLHSSTSSLEWQPAIKMVPPQRPSHLPMGMYEPGIRNAQISSPVLRKFSSSHGSVFHSELGRPAVRPASRDAINHSSLPSLDLHIAEDQGQDLIPSPNDAYPSPTGWSSPSQNRAPIFTKPISREPSFSSSSSSSSSPPHGNGCLDQATPPPFVSPAYSQPTRLLRFPIIVDGFLEKPAECQNLVSEVHVTPKPLPRTQLKVGPHVNSGPLNPVTTTHESPAGPQRNIFTNSEVGRLPGTLPLSLSLTPPLSPPEERRFHLASPAQVVQTPAPATFAGLAPLLPEPAIVEPASKVSLQSMMERARSFSRADKATPATVVRTQDTQYGSKMSVSTEESGNVSRLMENKLHEEAHLVCYLQRQDEEWDSQACMEARPQQSTRSMVTSSSTAKSRLEPAWAGMEDRGLPAAEEDGPVDDCGHPSGLGREPFGYVGIEAVLDQMRRKAMKTGFEFNIMVVGQSGLGKSTLVNTLFKSKISWKCAAEELEEKIPKTVELKSISHVIEEKGLKMKLTVIDTPGFGDQINNQNCWEPIMEFIQEQYEKYLREEIVINRKRRIPDSRIHCCIYFVPPTGHWLRPLDVEFMKRLGKVVNVVPVIAKADTMTLDEREEFKERIRQDLDAHGISTYPQRELDEDPEETMLNDQIREKIPFAVVGTDQEHQVNGKTVLGRKTKWGIIEVENEEHCEFARLRDLLIRSNLQDLKDITHNIHYESFRIQRLMERDVQPRSPGSVAHSPPVAKESNF